MRFHMLVLEGDREAETKREPPAAFTKRAYLDRKWRESRPCLRSRSFYLCRMVEEELRGLELDGSGKITVCAHRTGRMPGQENYIQDRGAQVSVYYLEEAEIRRLEEADKDAEESVILEILRHALLEIAQQSHCPGETAARIREAFERIAASRFTREEPIARLTKRSKTTGLTARVYRVLSAREGESWYVEITDRSGAVLLRETLGEGTRYVDRLSSRLYAKAEWRDDAFVILERFGREVVRTGVPAPPGKRPQRSGSDGGGIAGPDGKIGPAP